jgi:hypothetical protein
MQEKRFTVLLNLGHAYRSFGVVHAAAADISFHQEKNTIHIFSTFNFYLFLPVIMFNPKLLASTSIEIF